MNKDFLDEITPISEYAFAHKTNNRFLGEILESGYLLPCNVTGNENYSCVSYEDENGNLKEAPKIFMSFVRPSDKIKYDVISELETILILDPQIYLDYGIKNSCYFNIGWKYGKIDSNTMFFNDLSSEFSNEDNLKLNLNYLDINLGIRKDTIGKTPLTFRHNTELVVFQKDEPLKISLKKYLKYILIFPYEKVKGKYRKIPSYLDDLKIQDINRYNSIMNEYGHLIVDNLEDMKNLGINKYLNIPSWEDLKRYEKFEKMMKMKTEVFPPGYFN